MSSPTETCRCAAYKYPHRFMSGDCTGWSAVQEVWNKSRRVACLECRYYWREDPKTGEAIQSFCFLLENQKKHLPVDCPSLDRVVR